MTPPPRIDLLGRLLNSRPLTVRLDDATERRLRLYLDRLNRHMDDEPLDPDDDQDLANTLLGAAEAGIEADEHAHGLAGSIFGDVLSKEVMDAGREDRMRALRKSRPFVSQYIVNLGAEFHEWITVAFVCGAGEGPHAPPHDWWAIKRGESRALNSDGEWEFEPLPSSRSDEYLARTRFTLADALRRAQAVA